MNKMPIKWRVLVSSPQIRPQIDAYRPLLEENGIELEIYPTRQMMTEDQLLEVIEGFDGMIASDDQLTARVLERAKRLKVIAKWGTGLDSVDLEAAARLGIAVRNTPGAFSDSVADITIGYLILLARHLHKLDAQVKNGEWAQDSRYGVAGTRPWRGWGRKYGKRNRTPGAALWT